MSNIIQNLQNKGLLSDKEAEPYDPAELAFTSSDGRVGAWEDADTLKIDDQLIRLKGYDAEETAKIRPDGTFKSGEVGGSEQTKAVADLARSSGYDKLVDTGEVGAYGRPIYDLQNAAGDSWGNRLTAEGIVNPAGGGFYTTQKDLQDKAWSQLFRSANTARGQGTEFNVAADWIDQVFEEQGLAKGLKETAQDEQELASWKEAAKHDDLAREYYEGLHKDTVSVRSSDRDLANKARNPLSVAWDQGLNGVVEGGAGLLNLVGHTTGWEGLEDYAEGKIQLSHDDIAKMPSIIVDYKDVEDTGDFVEYVGNLAAMSIPYMALSLGGVAASAIGAPAALAVAAPAAVYAGQTWNEMEGEKSATIAVASGIGQAVLDRLGITSLLGSQVVSKSGRELLIKELAKQGISREAASNLIVKQTRRAAAELSGDAVKFAQDQVAKREILKTFLTRAGQGVISEGSTEVLQETTAYLSAVAGSDKVFEAGELHERLVNAAIGGGVLGGAFSVPSSSYNTGAWVDVAKRTAPAEAKLRAKQNLWAEEEAAANDGELPTHSSILRGAAARAGETRRSLKERSDADKKRKKERTWGETIGETAASVPGLWRGATRHILNEDLQERSTSARRLASLFGGQLFQMYSGATFESAKHLRLATYKNLIDIPLTTAQKFGIDTSSLNPDKALKAASDIIYKAYDLVGTDFDALVGTDLEQHIPALKEFAANADTLTTTAYNDQVKHGASIKKLDNYAFRHRALDPFKIESDRVGFQKDLQETFGVNATEARELTEAIINVGAVTTIDEAFSITDKGGFKPSSHHERTLQLSDNVEFRNKWLSNNVFENLSSVAKSAARYTSYQEYLGDGNNVVENLIADVEKELIESGLSKELAQQQADKAARGLQDYIDAESGNYKRPTSDIGRKAQTVQKYATTLTTFAALPLATISSFVELALLSRGLNQGQMGELSKLAKTEANKMWQVIDTEAKATATPGRRIVKDVGLFEWDVGATARTGIQEQTIRSQRVTDAFFKMIGLKQWTDFTRAARASIAMDYIQDKINIVEHATEVTNEVAQARDALRNLGLDPDGIQELFADIDADSEGQAVLPEPLRNAIFNFINDAVVLPTAANRPLFYQDPRFALFTQFQGFISAFQANILPKMYRDAFKGQTPSIKYNTFAVMAMMITMGFMSQYLKDLIKFGGPSPYLTDPSKKIQRAINSSGLLGTGERVINLAHPLYESRYNSSAEWAFDTALGESAAAGQGVRAVQGAGSVLEGDFEAAFKDAWKLTPIVAPFTGTRNKAAEWIFD